MKNIFLYVGKGAYQAKDIENFLAVFEYNYNRISELELEQLTPSDILIVPGGQIKAYLPAMGERGVEAIQKFVQNGGIYIGICAGVYIAGNSYDGIPGLNFFSQSLVTNNTRAIVDVFDEAMDKFQLVNENGPDLSTIKSDRVLLKDNNNNPWAIAVDHGRGIVYLFAAHPEGSIYYKLPPYDFSGAKYFKHFINRLTITKNRS